MSTLSPQAGQFRGALHLFAVRIYYEDTDLSGLVYHANYLRYMERARSDWVAQLGLNQRQALEAANPAYFVVTALSVEYRAPARLDDALVVHSRLRQLGGASMMLDQSVWRGDTRLVDARVRAAYVGVDATGATRPRRLPNALRDAMSALLDAKD